MLFLLAVIAIALIGIWMKLSKGDDSGDLVYPDVVGISPEELRKEDRKIVLKCILGIGGLAIIVVVFLLMV